MAKTAVKVGKLIDGNGGPVIDRGVVVIDGKRIAAVGSQSEVTIPPDATIIDEPGLTAMPGMMDLHLHIAQFNTLTFRNYRVAQFEVSPELQQLYALFHAQLCFERGFTTLRDEGLMSTRGLLTEHTIAVRDAIALGVFAGPRIIVSAFTVGTGSHLDLILPRAMLRNPAATADGVDEMRKLARQNLLRGADWLKTCASGGGGTDKESPQVRNHTQDELNAVCDEAHAQHAYCSIHCFTPQSQAMAIEAGADTIEHMVFHSDEMIEAIVSHGIPVCPTLLHRTDHAIEVRRTIGTPQFTLDKMKKIQPFTFETFAAMQKAGVKIFMGTDMGQEPDMGSNAMELEIYVKLGMTPMEAILTTTRNAAEAVHLDEDLGTLDVGKYADLLLVDGNPAEDITVLQPRENIKAVMKEGKIYVDRRKGSEKDVIDVEYASWALADG
ncbi:amidohydrolase family protein [Afifella pfennigii]|uniref:amidohydrolase family protein n=1 Tax=Afifella pfennigii TaxID=209897 RepID=UPI000554A6EC|nr:amidohydrolase family protein [Afifella pfennigii]